VPIKRKTHRKAERHGGWLIRVRYPITRRLTRIVWPCLAGADHRKQSAVNPSKIVRSPRPRPMIQTMKASKSSSACLRTSRQPSQQSQLARISLLSSPAKNRSPSIPQTRSCLLGLSDHFSRNLMTSKHISELLRPLLAKTPPTDGPGSISISHP